MKVIRPRFYAFRSFVMEVCGRRSPKWPFWCERPTLALFVTITRIPGFYKLLVKSIVAQFTSIGALILLQDHLDCHNHFRGMLLLNVLLASATVLSARKSVVCAWSRDDQANVTTTLIAAHGSVCLLLISQINAKITFRFYNLATWAPFSKRCSSPSHVVLTASWCYLRTSLYRNTASTRIITSGYDPRCLICTSTGTAEWLPAEFVKVYNNLDERSRPCEVRKNFCQCTISVDLAASHQPSLSSSALFKGDDCFTPVHVEEV